MYEDSSALASSGPVPPISVPGRTPLVRAKRANLEDSANWPGSWDAPWMALMLDEIDYGLILLDEDARVVYVNHMARCALQEASCLKIVSGLLRAALPADTNLLRGALHDAFMRRRRRLIFLGEATSPCTLAVVPLQHKHQQSRTLIVIGKQRAGEDLTIQGFASNFGLTLTEEAVLKSLCAGFSPTDIAQRNSVAMSTVRTQIHSIRSKTGIDSIASLVRRVALLPPLVGAIRFFGTDANRSEMDRPLA